MTVKTITVRTCDVCGTEIQEDEDHYSCQLRYYGTAVGYGAYEEQVIDLHDICVKCIPKVVPNYLKRTIKEEKDVEI